MITDGGKQVADFILSAFADEASWELGGQIAALQRNGLRHIEIRGVNGKGILDLTEDELKDVRQKLDAGGIQVSAIGSPIGKIGIRDGWEEHQEAFVRALRAARMLGTKRIRMFSFYIPSGESPEEYADEVCIRLNRLLDMAEAEGVICCHENEKGIFGDRKDRTLYLHQRLGPRLKGVFDPANYIQCGERPGEIFDSLLPYLDYMHIKDALSADGSVVPAGCGDGCLPELIRKFYQPGSARILSVEPHLTVFQGLENLQDEEVRHTYTYASQGEAFDAAVNALKDILNEWGYSYE